MTDTAGTAMPLYFIVSSGRCGSTMLSHIMQLHPDILSASEFINAIGEASNSNVFPDGVMDGRELWQRLSSPNTDMDALVIAGGRIPEMAYPYGSGRFRPDTGIPRICHHFLPMLTDDPDTMFDQLAAEVPRWPARRPADQYRAFLSHVAGLLGRQIIVERSGASSAYPPMLLRQYPDARFVHLYRNGPDTALSISGFPSARVLGIALDAVKAVNLPKGTPWEEIKAAAPPEFDGLLQPPFDVQRIRDYPIPLTFFAGRWSGMMQVAAAIFAKLPRDIWTNLKYEDLVDDLQGELTRIAGFLGVEAKPEWLAKAAQLIEPGRIGTAKARLDPAAFAELEAACEPGTNAIAGLVASVRAGSQGDSSIAEQLASLRAAMRGGGDAGSGQGSADSPA
jgi:Sulfotransferase family